MKSLTLLLLTAIFLLGCTEKKPIESDLTENLQTKVDSLQRVNDSLQQVLSTEKQDSIRFQTPIYDGSNLSRKGIANPVEFIEESLRERPELIPLKGVLGGTMRFTNIKPVGSDWVIANYEDGHIAGVSIYKYRLNKNGELEFELMDSVEP